MTLAVRVGIVLVLSAVSCAHDNGFQSRLVRAEENAAQAEKLLSEGNQQLQEGNLDKAARLLANARARVDDQQMIYYPDRENLADRLGQAEDLLEKAFDLRRRQQIAAQATIHRQNVEKAQKELRIAVDALGIRKNLSSKLVDNAFDAAKELEEVLLKGQELESNADYSKYVAKVRQQHAKQMPKIEFARSLVFFLEGPAKLRDQAKAKLDESKLEKIADQRSAILTEARDAFIQCSEQTKKLLAQHPTTKRQTFYLQNNRKSSPLALLTECRNQAKLVDRILTPSSKVKKTKPIRKKKVRKLLRKKKARKLRPRKIKKQKPVNR